MFTKNHSDADLYIGPSPWRLGIAFCMFLSLVGVGGWGLSNFLSKPDQGNDSSAGEPPPKPPQATGFGEVGEPLFYRVVGNTGVMEGSPFEHESSLEQELQTWRTENSALKPGTPGSPPPSRDPLAASAKTPSYTIELKKTTDRHEAEELVSALQTKGIQAFYTPMLSENYVIYRVRVGIYTSKAVAQKDLASMSPLVSSPGQITELR